MPRIRIQRKILRIFDILLRKKNKKKFGAIEYTGTTGMKICKKWLNQLKKLFNKNIINHLFDGESHQVVKITVT
jgi:hypothetical protein